MLCEIESLDFYLNYSAFSGGLEGRSIVSLWIQSNLTRVAQIYSLLLPRFSFFPFYMLLPSDSK